MGVDFEDFYVALLMREEVGFFVDPNTFTQHPTQATFRATA